MSWINLLPEEYIARQAQRRANRLCAVLFAVVMAAVLGATVVSAQGHRHTREVSERIDQAYGEAGRLIQECQNLEGTRGKMLQKAKFTAALLERVPRSYLLATITNALPAGASLVKIDMVSKRENTVVITKDTRAQYESGASRPPGGDAGNVDVTITLTGLAGTDVEVARFIAAMARCPLMETVDLVYSQEKKISQLAIARAAGERTVREFQVVMHLKSNADVRGTAPIAAGAGAPPAERTGAGGDS